MVAVRKRKPGKYQQPARVKYTVMVGVDLDTQLEQVCADTGLSKNSAVLLGTMVVCSALRKNPSADDVVEEIRNFLESAVLG